ncbi:hypothetical protein ACFYXM_33315 [Streptomyces sp. NPDC002476]
MAEGSASGKARQQDRDQRNRPRPPRPDALPTGALLPDVLPGGHTVE